MSHNESMTQPNNIQDILRGLDELRKLANDQIGNKPGAVDEFCKAMDIHDKTLAKHLPAIRSYIKELDEKNEVLNNIANYLKKYGKKESPLMDDHYQWGWNDGYNNMRSQIDYLLNEVGVEGFYSVDKWHVFDPDDKATWPKEEKTYVMLFPNGDWKKGLWDGNWNFIAPEVWLLDSPPTHYKPITPPEDMEDD